MKEHFHKTTLFIKSYNGASAYNFAFERGRYGH